jgi:lysozyme family protein
MKWLIDLILRLFQRPAPVTPPEPPTEPVKVPEKPEPPKTEPTVTRPAEASEMFGGGKSGGGGASGTIPEPPTEPPFDEAVAYREALRLILRFEGGYVNDPDDPGGETNKGVTKKVYDEYRKSEGLPLRSVRDITDEEVADIYRKSYWIEGKCDKVGAVRLAIVHFDACVNAGIKQAAKLLQRTVGATDDGAIGSGTLSKVAAKIEKDGDLATAKECLNKRRDFYNSLVKQKPVLQKFLKGWLNRVATLEKYVTDRKA